MTVAAPGGTPVAPVTRGTRGIGAALSRRPAAAEKLAAESREVVPRQLDVGDPAACGAAKAGLHALTGSVLTVHGGLGMGG